VADLARRIKIAVASDTLAGRAGASSESSNSSESIFNIESISKSLYNVVAIIFSLTLELSLENKGILHPNYSIELKHYLTFI